MRTYCYYAFLIGFAFIAFILVSVSPVVGQAYKCDYSRFKTFKADHYPKSAVLQRVSPKYPSAAKRDGIEDVVTVKIMVNREGEVIRACMLKGNKIFQREAEKSALKWRFKPESLNIIRKQDRRREYFVEMTIVFIFKQRTDSKSIAQYEKLTCDDWHNKVDSHTPLNLGGISNKSEDEINYGIGCLLQLEGKKENSNVEGATRGEASQLFGATSKEVAALYYISYLFYQKWDHADAPFLVGKDEKLNSNKTVCNAYKSYRKWFKKVKEIGLEEARKQKLDPLTGSDVSWY